MSRAEIIRKMKEERADRNKNWAQIEAASRVTEAKYTALKNMFYGALWFIGGAIVTGVTYSLAREGGVYIVTYGAILLGGLQFLLGVFQYLMVILGFYRGGE